MNKEDIINKLMDYLYEDISPQERSKFELWLKENPQWQSDLNDLRATRHLFSVDTPVKTPSFYGIIPTKITYLQRLKPILTIAASIAILFLVGAWSKPEIRYSSGVFTLSFGASSIPSPSLTGVHEISQNPNSNPVFTTAHQESMLGKMEDTESRIMEVIHQNNQQLSRQLKKQIKINTHPTYSSDFITFEDFQSFITQERNKWSSEQEHQMELIIQYIELVNQQNKELIRNSFMELSQLFPDDIQENNSTKLK